VETVFERSGSYTIDEQAIRDLYAAIEKFLGAVPRLELEFVGPGADRDKLSANSVDEVLNDPLVRRKRIRGIRVRGSVYDNAKQPRTVRLSIDDRWSAPIDLAAEADHDRCAVLKSEIEGLLIANRTNYALLYPGRRVLLAIGSVLALVSGVAVVAVLESVKMSPITLGLLAGLASAGSVGGASILREAVFPQLVINIGRSGERARRIASARKLVFIGIVLALVVGVASTLIVDWVRT
jgi:hypothetical protein